MKVLINPLRTLYSNFSNLIWAAARGDSNRRILLFSFIWLMCQHLVPKLYYVDCTVTQTGVHRLDWCRWYWGQNMIRCDKTCHHITQDVSTGIYSEDPLLQWNNTLFIMSLPGGEKWIRNLGGVQTFLCLLSNSWVLFRPGTDSCIVRFQCYTTFHFTDLLYCLKTVISVKMNEWLIYALIKWTS